MKLQKSSWEGCAVQGKSAIVTGSTQGIGLGIARALAHEGVNVMMNGLGDQAEITRNCKELANETGSEICFSAADMRIATDIQAMVQEAEEVFGSIDILVNNAGVQHVKALHQYPEEKWDEIIAVDLSAAFHTTKAVLPKMRDNKWGRIINISSAHGLVASPHKSAYVAAKHGLIGLTKVTALESARHNITCNAVCPGFVWTKLVEKQIDDVAAAQGIAREKVVEEVMLVEHATKEFTTIEQIQEMVLFLCSDHARNITGTAIPMDGGWTAH